MSYPTKQHNAETMPLDSTIQQVKPWNRLLLSIGAVFLLLFASISLIATAQEESYLTSLNSQSNPDAIQYVQLAENIAKFGVYSRHPDASGEPDILRTPLYPLFIIISGGLIHPMFLFASQAILILISLVLTFRLGKRTLNSYCGLIAAIFLATDILVINSCFQAMTEILFLFLTLLALEALNWPCAPSDRGISKSRVFLGGILTGISTLARPSNLYLPLILIAGHFFFSDRRPTTQSLLRYSVLLLIGTAIPIVPWIIRNHRAVGVAKITNVDKHGLIYFVGAGALQARHGWDRATAQQYLQETHQLPSYSQLQNPWEIPEKTTKELYESVAPKAFSIATDDPLMLIKSTLIGISKASLAHSAGSMSRILGGKWTSIRTYRANSIHLWFIFVTQMLHTTVSLSFCGIAYLRIISGNYPHKSLMCLPLAIAFYYLMIAMMGYDAVSRARISCLPFIYVLAGFGIESALHFLRRGKAPRGVIP